MIWRNKLRLPSGAPPIQSWTGNAYTNEATQIASATPNYATSFAAMNGGNPSTASPAPQSIFAPAPSKGPYVGSVNLYVRNFAPWFLFGPDAYAEPFPCPGDCFYGDNRNFSTSLGVTSRISGTVHLLLPMMAPLTSNVFSNESRALYRIPPFNTATGHPTMKKLFLGDGHLTLHLAGSNPLVKPSPDIDTHLDITGTITEGQLCFSGRLYGDAFPNTEVFVINSKGQATTLLTFATTQDRNIGPFTLISDNDRDMGSFSSVCVAK